VSQQQNGLARAGSTIPRYQVALGRNSAAQEEVGFREARRFQPGRGRFGNRRGGAGSVPRLDLDELLVDIARELLFRIRRHPLRGQTGGSHRRHNRQFEHSKIVA